MKFMMIFEAVDKATRTMKKIMSAEKRAAAAVKAGGAASKRAASDAAAATTKHVSALNRLGSAARSAYSAVQRGAAGAARAVVDLHRKTVALGRLGASNVRDGVGRTLRGLGVLASAALALIGSTVLAANHLVGTASQFEKFQTVLEQTEGSAEAARTAMSWVTGFAARTPYELNEVMESFVALRAYGLDPTNGLLRDLGDTAAAMNKPLSQAVEAIADAVTGENERLKEFGIRAAVTGNEIAYSYTVNGQRKVVKALKNDPAGIQAAITSIMRERFGGAMLKLSSTWDGMVSNMIDIWSQFQLAIMNAGLFDWMKGKLAGVLETVNRMKDTGELDRWAATIGQRIQAVLEATWQFAIRTYAMFEALSGHLSAAADYVGGWENLGYVLAGLAFGPTLISTAAGLVQIAYGLGLIAAALVANPIVLIIAAIVAGAVAIYVYWEPIKAFFIDLWNSVAAGAAAAKTAIAEWLGFDPVAALSAAWAGLQAAVTLYIDATIAAASLAWEGIKLLFHWSPVGAIAANWNTISTKVSEIMATVSDAVSGAWEGMRAIFEWSPRDVVAATWGFLAEAVGQSVNGVAAVVIAVWDRLKVIFAWSPAEAIRAAWAGMADLVGELIGGVVNSAASAWEGVKSVFTFGESAQATIDVTDPATILAAQQATAALKTDMQAVAAISTAPAMAEMTRLQTAADGIYPAVTGAVRQAQAFLANISFYNQGVAMMDTLAAGIRARAAVVTAEIQKMAQSIRDHLPSSPAKVGPLSDLHRLRFGETIAGSIRAAPMVKAMRAATAATLAAATPAVASGESIPDAAAVRSEVARSQAATGPSSSGMSLTYSPVIHLSGDAERAKDDFLKLLDQHKREIADMMAEEARRKSRRDF